MAYTAFDGTKPDASAQTPSEFDQSIRDNQNALVDAIISGVGLAGWDFQSQDNDGTHPASDEDEPESWVLVKNDNFGVVGEEHVRVKLTWGTTGGEDGNIIQVVLEHTSSFVDWTSGWDTIGTLTVSYSDGGTGRKGIWA